MPHRLHYVPNVESYRYDAFGRRIMAWAVNGGNILSQYGQDGVLRYQSDGRRSVWRNYIYLAGSLIAERETAYVTAAHTIKYQHTDALGSPVAVTDAYAFVIERNEYEPYGAVLGTKRDGPGYTGHVFDTQTGLNYMQQRYYDPQVGRFLNVDPVSVNPRTGGNFNRYWYANSSPYKFTDPDGRAPCVGTRIGACVNGETVAGLSRGHMIAAAKNPDAYLARLNERANRQDSVHNSARYFAVTALPVTIGTGREVGADVIRYGPKRFSVENYVLGDPPGPGGAGSVVQGQSYSSLGTRVAIIHTHPANTNFSGLPAGVSGRTWNGWANHEGDINASVRARVDSYVVMLNGGILHFDYEGMHRAIGPNANLNAQDYIKAIE